MSTQEVKIRPLELSDKSQMAILANNKKVWNNLRNIMPFPYSKDDAEFFINLTKNDNPRQHFGIEYKGILCGVIGLIVQKDVYCKSAEIGYWIGEPFWGKGIATHAVGLMTQYGFSELNLIRIYAGIFEFNEASMKVLENNQFKNEGVFRKSVFKNENIYDEHRYSRLRDE